MPHVTAVGAGYALITAVILIASLSLNGVLESPLMDAVCIVGVSSKTQQITKSHITKHFKRDIQHL